MLDYVPIPNTSLQIALSFVQVGEASAPTPHYVQGPGGALWREVLLQKIPDSARANVSTLLNTPLQVLFDNFWASVNSQPDVSKRPGTLIKNAIQKEASNAYDISVNLPPKGPLRAVTGNVSSGLVGRLPSGEFRYQLTLSYLLPGVSATFKTTTNSVFGSWADPNLNLTFDGEYLVEIVVPETSSTPLSINTEFLTHNMTGSAGNVLTGVEIFFKEFIEDMGALLQGNSFPLSPLNSPDQSLSAPVPDLFASLATSFVSAGKVGFTQLNVIVDQNPPPGNPPGNTVELILTHPFNAGPSVRLDTGPWNPELIISPLQLYPGDTITIKGNGYPPPRATKFNFYGPFASNLNPVDVQWGVPPVNQLVPPSPQKQEFTPDQYGDIMIPGLRPSTRYSFRFRTYDVEGFIASAWSNWTLLTTSPTDQVQLTLQDTSHSPATVTAIVSDQNAFTSQLQIPAAEVPGTYEIQSTVPGHASIVSSSFTIIAHGVALSPTIQMLDGNGVALDHVIEVDFRESYMFLGMHWQIGWVDLYLDSATGSHMARVWSDQTGMFKAGVKFPDALKSVGEHYLVGVQGKVQAKTGVFYPGPPR